MTTKLDIIKLKTLAAVGNAEAMFILGNNYLYGLGVEVDINLAHHWLTKSSEKGFDNATDALKNSFAENGKSTDFSEDFSIIYEDVKAMVQAADKGAPSALHLKGVGKLTDDTNDFMFNRGLNDIKIAANKNYPPSMFSLGLVYFLGNRVSGKKEEGLDLIRRAAELGFFPAIKFYARFSPESMFPLLDEIVKKNNDNAEAFRLLSEYYLRGIIVEQNNKEGIRLLKKAADLGDIDSCYDLALIYEFGRNGEQKDIPLAISYYEKGVEKEDVDCMNNLGSILKDSKDYPHDYKRAFELFSKASANGYGLAYNNLGTCYKKAIGTEADKEKALNCYIKATELGCGGAYWNLYLYYMDGIAVDRDFFKAVEWLKKGDEADNLDCTYQLTKHYMNGDGVERDAKKYFEYLFKASTHGYDKAYNELGDCYRYGIGTDEDGASAFEWYQKAAKTSIKGITSLAQCYSYSIGTEQNHYKAIKLYQIAAEKGDAQAQCDLGICYRFGEGVEQNPQKAIEWYLKAAKQGHGGALNNLGIMYDNGIGTDIDHEKAFQYFKDSAETGFVEGQCCLAIMYFSGRGIEQNYEEAVKWFQEAAEQGEPDSMFHLAICYDKGLGVEVNKQLAIHYLKAAADRGFPPAINAIKDCKQ